MTTRKGRKMFRNAPSKLQNRPSLFQFLQIVFYSKLNNLLCPNFYDLAFNYVSLIPSLYKQIANINYNGVGISEKLSIQTFQFILAFHLSLNFLDNINSKIKLLIKHRNNSKLRILSVFLLRQFSVIQTHRVLSLILTCPQILQKIQKSCSQTTFIWTQ